MSGTQVVVVKKALIAGLAALTVPSGSLEGVGVQYAWKPNQTLRERIYTGRASGSHKPANLKAGRTHRDESMSFELTILVEKVGAAGTAEDAETRAVAIGTVVEEWIADNRRALIPTIQWLVIEGDVDLVFLFNDSGHLAELTYTVTYNARLE